MGPLSRPPCTLHESFLALALFFLETEHLPPPRSLGVAQVSSTLMLRPVRHYTPVDDLLDALDEDEISLDKMKRRRGRKRRTCCSCEEAGLRYAFAPALSPSHSYNIINISCVLWFWAALSLHPRSWRRVCRSSIRFSVCVARLCDPIPHKPQWACEQYGIFVERSCFPLHSWRQRRELS